MKKIIKRGLLVSSLFSAMWMTTIQANSSALDAEAIYNKSVDIFSQKNMSFLVDSLTTYDDGVIEKRTFFLAKVHQEHDKRSVLIRFVEPEEIKCTAVLVNKEGAALNRYAYFPALNRVRIIPESDKQKEVFGIGISYDELSQPKGVFETPRLVELNHQKTYQITLLLDDKKSIYFINADSYRLEKIQILNANTLEKEITINAIDFFADEQIISDWQVNDLSKKRTIHYQLQADSISKEINPSLFYKNRLNRCAY